MYFTTQAQALAAGRPADAVGLARYVNDGVRSYQWVTDADVDELGVYDVDFELLLTD